MGVGKAAVPCQAAVVENEIMNDQLEMDYLVKARITRSTE